MSSRQQIVVIGAGVSGLTSAICLAEAGWPVRVWADTRPPRTTSAVAGAVIAPRLMHPPERAAKWNEDSLRVFRGLAGDPSTGVLMAPAMIVGEIAADQKTRIPDLRPADPAEVPGGYGEGFHGIMPMIDMPHYLDYLTRRLTVAGVDIDERRVHSLAEAADAAPIVVNCAGLGAAALTGDGDVQPVFGQHVVLTNPGVQQQFLDMSRGDEFVCFFPHPRRVVCGGVNIEGRWDTTPEPAITERILEGCRRIEPRLRDADVIEVITGLRPHRPSVRLEAEPLGQARCIHNYGHGGNGVTLSWGCARDVVRLVTG